MEKITSTNNPTFKKIKKLLTKKGRQKAGLYLIEGFHLIEEAQKSGLDFAYLLGTKESLANHDYGQAIEITDELAKELSQTTNSQSIFAVIKLPVLSEQKPQWGKWVLLDHLQDPGNLGTIIRTADACGFTGVILSPDCVDLFNPKVQRAMQGSQFHIELIVNDLASSVVDLQAAGIPVYASFLDKKAKSLPEFTKEAQVGIIIGNEAHGVNEDLAKLCDSKVYIPIFGRAESYNAGVAAGILMYHFAG
ncbi:MAG: RNA methyltransferase [Lactobacillus sp.]|nr:RNA methyltransferase [Lactobacillus sp.]